MKTSRPIIGVTTQPDIDERQIGVSRGYMDAVLEAGGIPMLLPYGPDTTALIDDIISTIDGLLLIGGGDLSPDCFGGAGYPDTSSAPVSWLSPLRDIFEVELARVAYETDLPTLGICRGMQIMNYTFGGNLVRDVAEIEREGAIPHEHRQDIDSPYHEVALEEDSHIARILGTTSVGVNSLHHQAVLDIAPNARVTGRAPDGIVEVLEFPEKGFYLGVQWHPEVIRNTPELFRALIEASS